MTLEQEFEELENYSCAPSSQAIYFRSYSRFLHQIKLNHPNMLNDDFRNLVAEAANLQAFRKKLKLLKPKTKRNFPLDLNTFNERSFLLWILSLKKKDGQIPSKKALDGHKSALYNLFRDHDLETTDEFKNSGNN